MASSASRGGPGGAGGAGAGGERMIHQDFIARIRFSNALPPPPIPPKLLDIPNTGLASGQYTSPSFATRLFREQPVNIEADAELGMPLDLVGMPGVFDGDESSIQAPAHPPSVHPHDRPLLRPLSTLGKPKVAEASVSFLRRTEYISAVQARKSGAESSVFLKPTTGNAARRQGQQQTGAGQKRGRDEASPELDRDSPAYIKRKIEKGFEYATACLKDRSRVRHPNATRRNNNVRLVQSYPMLPDLDAFPDSGAYVTIKFANNPVAGANSGTPSSSAAATYDARLLAGIFQPIARTPDEEAAYQAALAAHEADPAHAAKPPSTNNWNFYLPDTLQTATNFRRKWDVDDEEAHDDDALYTTAGDGGAAGGSSTGGKPCFRYSRVRAYETAEEMELDHATKYDREIILSYTDAAADAGLAPEASGRAVLYYPVMQRSTLRSQRTKNIARTILSDGGEPAEGHIDLLEVRVEEPTEQMLAHSAQFREHPLDFIGEEDEEEGEGGEGAGAGREGEDEDDEDADGAVIVARRDGGAPNGHSNHIDDMAESDEQDAEGDEDE